MLKTACGMVAGTLSMSGYNLADTYFVGQLTGESPMAAMGFTFPVIMLVGCLFHGLGIGVMTTAAQALGARKRFRAATLITSGIWLVVAFSIFLAALGMAFSGWLFSRFGATGETLELVNGYMRIWFFGCATASLSMTGNDVLIAVGDSRMVSVLMFLGMLVNVALDPILIFGFGWIPAMGIRGAALATVIAQGVCALAVLLAVAKRHGLIRFRRMPWGEVRPAWNRIVRFAGPATLGMLMMPIGSVILTHITSEFGDAAVGGVAAAGRLEAVAFVFPMSLGMSLTPFIGQNYGAKLYGRIREGRRFAMRFALGFLLAAAVIYFFIADWVAAWFLAEPALRPIMAECLRITAWGFAGVEIHRFAGFTYTGCGRPSVAAWLNALRIMVFMVPFSLLALYFRSLTGLFVARLAADVLAGGIGWFPASRMTWRLPADGEPHPVPVSKRELFRRLFPGRLRALVFAQNDIDGRSSTQ